jgi:hypothetical protein
MRQVGDALTLVVLFGVLVPGCGGGGGPKTYPVEGKVVFSDGTPAKELAGRIITFQPAEGDALPQGEIKEDATFRLRTNQPGDGAPPGKYRVAIGPNTSVLPRDNPPLVIAKRYHDPKTSGLEATVESRATQVTLKVDRAP